MSMKKFTRKPQVKCGVYRASLAVVLLLAVVLAVGGCTPARDIPAAASEGAATAHETTTEKATTTVLETTIEETTAVALEATTQPPAENPAAAAENIAAAAPATSIRYLGAAARSEKGYTLSKAIEVDDPHFGWMLGRFSLSGHTHIAQADGAPVFIKTLGDELALSFLLEQNIDMLNGNEKLSIGEDKKGYDEYFGIEKTNFAHGTLIIKSTDSQNASKEPVVYTDFLSAKTIGANTEVELFEEGDYEVSLNYAIKNVKWLIPTYTYYRIFFKFSVRNGNCMVFPFDVATKRELENRSVTANGFTIDLAESRYLDVFIKREVLTAGGDGLDTRYNHPARDGYEYTEEGIYTITISNNYTGEQEIKKICVGTNSALRALMK